MDLLSIAVETLYDRRRYLTNFDSWRAGHLFADVLVVGAGVAGARAAIEAADQGANVLLICKSAFNESATRYAQGGVANARSHDDSAQIHLDDTIRVGCGLGRRAALDTLVNDATARIDEAIEWGVKFDRAGDHLALGREGGHSAARILHADGDATGLELARVLTNKMLAHPNIRVFENCFLIDLLSDEQRCLGAVAFNAKHGHQLLWARQTILASGGAGRLYRETSNPIISTGDGIAVAYRAGAQLADLEFMQFHPTTLYVAGAARALISEAVRGEGAVLVDRQGVRFMEEYHEAAELAPRDVVSRAIVDRMRKGRSNCVYLDVCPIGIDKFAKRFPGISKLCTDFQIDFATDAIPVRPAAHYMIGGVVTNLDGRTSLDGLICCGEVACTGVHGANRLASNSLLEGLVFGRIAGATAARLASVGDGKDSGQIRSHNPPSNRTELDLVDIRNSLRSVMWRNAGIERSGERLHETREIVEFWGHYVLDKTFDHIDGWETQNMLSLARLIAISAAERTESIGVHWRTDATSNATSGAAQAGLYHTVIERCELGPNLTRVGLDFAFVAADDDSL